MADRDFIARIEAEPQARTKIELYVAHLCDSMPRAAPVQLLARDAGAADADAAGVYAQTRAEMLHGMTLFARNLHQTGQLQVSANEARDLLWTYFSAEVYELLVLERGWSTKRYGRFLADAKARWSRPARAVRVDLSRPIVVRRTAGIGAKPSLHGGFAHRSAGRRRRRQLVVVS
jgi:hypothetical protein